MGYIGIAIITFRIWASTGGLDCADKDGHCTDVAGVVWPLFLPIWTAIHKPLLFWSCVAGIGGSLLGFHQIKAFFGAIEYKPIWLTWKEERRKKKEAEMIRANSHNKLETEAIQEVNKLLRG
jgi:hypothetical protein